MKHNGKLYVGGLAEFVSSPSDLTLSYFSYWFTGKGSVGRAMRLLGLPYQKISLPLLVNDNGQVVVHGLNEEKTLYEKTIFVYRQKTLLTLPSLQVAIPKVISFANLRNTLQILLKQSQWIARPSQVEQIAQHLVTKIPDYLSDVTFEQEEEILIDAVWPPIIAIGMLAEYFHHYVVREAGENSTEVLQYVAKKTAQDDWFFQSFTDQKKVASEEMTFSNYMDLYGMRADNDYELSCPRWHEIKEDIRKRIRKQVYLQDNAISSNIPKRLVAHVNTLILLQQLRSEAKKKALVHIDYFRKLLIRKVSHDDITHLTRDEILHGNTSTKRVHDEKKTNTHVDYQSSGKGRSVSAGKVTGIVKNVEQIHEEMPEGSVGIFPNASPQFAQQFPKCKGMIFLQGGQTSHGAIVAREFGIPALIDASAHIPDGVLLTIDGTTGEWKVDEKRN